MRGMTEHTLGCPRCPDGHTPFNRGSHPWNVRVDTDTVRGDGAPSRLIVERSAGEHCAQEDADALYELINRRTGQQFVIEFEHRDDGGPGRVGTFPSRSAALGYVERLDLAHAVWSILPVVPPEPGPWSKTAELQAELTDALTNPTNA